MYLENLCWKEAEEFIQKDPVVLVPLGSVEQHGHIGPLGTDFIIPDKMAQKIEIDLREFILVLPTMPYGSCPNHMGFSGTIDIGCDALYTVMKGITTSLMRHGLRRFVFLNGHGGNSSSIERIALELNKSGGIGAIVNWWTLAGEMNPRWKGGHGQGQEASMMLAIRPESVKKENLSRSEVHHLSKNLKNSHISTVMFKGNSIRIPRMTNEVTSSGGYGGADLPSEASKEQGEEMMSAITTYVIEFLEEFKKLDL